MYKNKTILGIVPARGGSKGIPRKNIYPIAGRPLIEYTISAAKQSKYLDRLIVSTDDFEICELSKKLGAEIPFIRPAELALDNSKSEDAIVHAINWMLNNEGMHYDYFLLLQPTSPLRSSKHIDESIEKLIKDENQKVLISITRVTEYPQWMKIINSKGFLENYLDKSKSHNIRRQDIPELFIPNGAIYMAETNAFKIEKTFNTESTTYYFMDKITSIDIDDFDDIELISLLLNKFKA